MSAAPPVKSEGVMEQCVQTSSSLCHAKQEAEQQRAGLHQHQQHAGHSLSADIYNVSDLCRQSSS